MRHLQEQVEGGVMAWKTKDATVAFMYELLRDHVQPGVVEKIIVDQASPGVSTRWFLSNEYLAAYADNLVKRLNMQTANRGCGEETK